VFEKGVFKLAYFLLEFLQEKWYYCRTATGPIEENFLSPLPD